MLSKLGSLFGGGGGGHGHSHGGGGGGGGHGHSHGGGGGGGGHGHGQPQQQPGVGGMPRQMSVPTNFMEAVMTGSMGIVTAFWEGSAMGRDQNGSTPLHWAAVNGHPHICRFLLDNGADVNAVDSQNQTAMHWAATQNQIETIHLLLDAGADATIRDSNNNTPHGAAAVNDALASLYALFKAVPVTVDQADAQGNTLLAWGAYKGNLDIVRYCHECINVPFNTRGKFNRTPLHWAAREGHTDVARYLIGLGLDPEDEDSGGYNSTKWAKERNHYEAYEVCKNKETGLPNRNWSTLAAINANKQHILHGAAFIGWVLGWYFLMQWLPPIFVGTAIAGYLSKNAIATTGRQKPIIVHKEDDKMEDRLGIPKDFNEAFHGPKHMHQREPFALLMFPLVIILQVMVLLHHEHAASSGKSKHHSGGGDGFEGSIPMAVFWSLLAAKIFGALAKANSSRDIIANNPDTKEFPLWKAIDDRDYDDISGGMLIFDSRAMLRVPARAFWCEQLGCLVKRYDSWSNIIDAPLSQANMRWYVGLLISLLLSQMFILFAAWDANMAAGGCASSAEAAEKANGDLIHYSWCTTIMSLLFNGGPCPSKHSWLGGVEWKRLGFAELILGTADTRANTLNIILTIVLVIFLAVTVFQCLLQAAGATSTAELSFPVTPSQHGGLVPIKRKVGYGNAYGEGNMGANLLAFILGRDGERWDGAMHLITPNKKQPQVHPMVVPPPEARKKRGGD